MHAEAPNPAATDWTEIVGLYDILARLDPSPVIALNRAVALAMRDGPAAGLPLIDAISALAISSGLPVGPCGESRAVPPPRQGRGSAHVVWTGARAHPAGTRATVSGTAPH